MIETEYTFYCRGCNMKIATNAGRNLLIGEELISSREYEYEQAKKHFKEVRAKFQKWADYLNKKHGHRYNGTYKAEVIRWYDTRFSIVITWEESIKKNKNNPFYEELPEDEPRERYVKITDDRLETIGVTPQEWMMFRPKYEDPRRVVCPICDHENEFPLKGISRYEND